MFGPIRTISDRLSLPVASIESRYFVTIVGIQRQSDKRILVGTAPGSELNRIVVKASYFEDTMITPTKPHSSPLKTVDTVDSDDTGNTTSAAENLPNTANSSKNVPEKLKEKEYGGPSGLEPTRYGDWEKNGRCTDF